MEDFVRKCTDQLVGELQKDETKKMIYGATLDPAIDHIKSNIVIPAIPYYVGLLVLMILMLIANIGAIVLLYMLYKKINKG
jgi:hypothetical protein